MFTYFWKNVFAHFIHFEMCVDKKICDVTDMEAEKGQNVK